MSYSEELVVKAGKSSLFSLLADPFKLSGIIGHFSILGIEDGKTGKRYPPSEVKKQEDKYWIAIVFGVTSGKVISSAGTLDGPIISPNSIQYKAETDDGKDSFKILFILRDHPLGTKVSITVEFNVKAGLLSKPFYGDYSSFAEHIVKGHIIPYIRSISSIDIGLKEIKRVRGNVEELLRELRNLHNIYGAVVIKGENFRFASFIDDRELKGSRIDISGNTLGGGEALSKLLILSGLAEMVIYEVPADDLIESLLKSK
ncbi:hypothetical protein [Acidianus sp. RZ1]|uniref:hypothetical protein n=1 Tax=Acidianus sp. RZ1 TaxID=1540082 RepID=UPI00149211C5|nr:hypothetical protein [Acidianus sp. RZ1]NON63032.1 hypothetical protein [Acidianus sp. RZ1]